MKKSVKRHQNEDKSGPEAKRQTLNAVNESPVRHQASSCVLIHIEKLKFFIDFSIN